MSRYPKNSRPKLTNKLIKDICLAIKNGVFLETAAALNGISKDTLYRWLRDSKKEDAGKMVLKLSDAILRAFAEDEIRQLSVINKAAFGIAKSFKEDDSGNVINDEFGFPIVTEYLIKPDWKASAYRLSRRDPLKWGNKCLGEDLSIIKESEDHNVMRIEFVSPKRNVGE